MRPITLDEITEVTGGALVHGTGEESITSVSTDTRTTAPGALFVALSGERHDGHDYARAARNAGAAAILVDRTLAIDLPEIVVVDTLHALGDIARYHRDRFALPVVGVTGSAGKTTTKELIAHLLSLSYSVQKSAANFNNEIGVPQTIFGLEDTHTALVLEMAMRGPGEIFRLAEIGAPTIGVITGIGVSHIERLGSTEAIADAKAELLEMLPADGVAILPADDPFLPRMRTRFAGETITCALDGAAADVVATDVVRDDTGGWRFTVRSPWGEAAMTLPTPGRFNVRNALLALAVAARLGISLEAIRGALAAWTAPPMRLELLHTSSGVTILSDAYNAAPDSMRGALEALRGTPATGRRIAVLGEMRELGAHAAEAHRSVGRAVAETAPDRLCCVGPLTGEIATGARAAGFPASAIEMFNRTDEAARALAAFVQPGDAVLVKGSRALEMERIVAALTGSDSGAHA